MKFIDICMNVKDLVFETLKENKKLIIALYALFIITFIASWIIVAPKMASIPVNATITNTPGADSSAVELFIHNELSGIITYFASIFFGIPAILMVIYNGFNIAALGPLFAKVLPNGGIMYIIYLIPHGIFEFTGMVLDATGGILFFLFIWRFIRALIKSDTNGASDAFDKTKKTLIQSITVFVIAFCLTLIAAPIEAYLSTNIAEFLMHLFGLW